MAPIAKILLMIAFVALQTVSSCSSSVSEPQPVEQKLANVDAGAIVSKDDITVARFRSLLDQLSKTFVEDRSKIAEMTYKAREMLREKGIQEKMLTMMEGMNKLFWKPIGNQSYAEYIAMYVMLREKGESHEEAISDIQSFLRSLSAH